MVSLFEHVHLLDVAEMIWRSRLASFLFFTISAALAGSKWPQLFLWCESVHIELFLGCIMFLMGVSIPTEQIRIALAKPKCLLIGLACQLLVMPLAAIVLVSITQMRPSFEIGIVVVACCPGGTASNVVAYLGRLDVALSVTLTCFSTILSILYTPLLIYLLVGKQISVDILPLVWSLARIVGVPIALGGLVRAVSVKTVNKAEPVVPWIATMLIATIVGSVVGHQRELFAKHFMSLIVACSALHVFGGQLGRVLTQKYLSNTDSLTISLETAMQNAGLATALSIRHFSPEVATPCVVCGIMNCVVGASLLAYWRSRQPRSINHQVPE